MTNKERETILKFIEEVESNNERRLECKFEGAEKVIQHSYAKGQTDVINDLKLLLKLD